MKTLRVDRYQFDDSNGGERHEAGHFGDVDVAQFKLRCAGSERGEVDLRPRKPSRVPATRLHFGCHRTNYAETFEVCLCVSVFLRQRQRVVDDRQRSHRPADRGAPNFPQFGVRVQLQRLF